MSDEHNSAQNGAATSEFKIPEGEKYLLVRLSSKGEFQVLYSDPFAGISLLAMADEFVRAQIRKDFGIDRAPSGPGFSIPPGLDASSLTRLQNKIRGRS